MTISRLPLTFPMTNRAASTAKDSRSVNCLFESNGGEKFLVKRPGVVKFGPTLPAGAGRGLMTWDKSIITATSNTVYEVIGEASYNTLGTLQGTLPLSFVETAADSYLAMHDGASLYYIDKATRTFTAPSGTVNSVHIDTPGGYYGYATACTVASGATTTITKTAHGLVDGQGISFSAATMPAGLTAGTAYQVRFVDANTFTVNTVTTGGGIGAAVATTTNGTSVVYSAAPVVTFSAGTVTALGTATLYNHQVSGVIVTVAGTYTTIPTVTFGIPPAISSTATATITVNFPTSETLNIISGGAGYVAAPTWVFVDAGGVTRIHGYTWINSSGQVIGGSSTSYGDVSTVTQPGPWFATIQSPTATTATGTVVMGSGGLTGPFAYGLEYLDGYVFVATTAGRIYQSNKDDPTTWGALNFIEVNSDPDSVIALFRQLNYLVAFGQWSTEVFYNAGNPTGSILGNNKSAKLEIGCAAGPSVAKAEHTLLWVGQSKTEGRSVYLMEGLSPVKVSNKYIEKYLNASTLVGVRSYCFKLSGHTLYVLTLHDLDLTLVYDIDEKEWYQWTSFNGTVEGYFKYVAFNSNIEYAPALHLQHDDDGQLYKMDPTASSDDVQPIYFRVVSPRTDSGTTKRKFYPRVEVVGDKVAGNAQIRHTENDYQTWSPYRTVNLALTRPILYQNGAARRRAWELLVTDNVPVRLEALEIDFDVGEIGPA